MAKLDVDLLLIFEEIYKTASITCAAENLGLAQPTVSIALNKLRSHFGDVLFSRTAKGMEPTPFSEHLIGRVQNATSALQEVLSCRVNFDPLTEKREFRICMTDVSEMVVLPRLFQYMKEHAPGVIIDAHKITSRSPDQLKHGQIDLAIGLMPYMEAGFYQQKLFDRHFVCLASSNHPRIGESLTIDEFLREGHIVVKNVITGLGIGDRALANCGVQRRVVLRAPSHLGVAHMVAQTDLLATVLGGFSTVCAGEGKIKVLPFPLPIPPYAVKQHWHERYHADPANKWLRQVIAKLFKRDTSIPSTNMQSDEHADKTFLRLISFQN